VKTYTMAEVAGWLKFHGDQHSAMRAEGKVKGSVGLDEWVEHHENPPRPSDEDVAKKMYGARLTGDFRPPAVGEHYISYIDGNPVYKCETNSEVNKLVHGGRRWIVVIDKPAAPKHVAAKSCATCAFFNDRLCLFNPPVPVARGDDVRSCWPQVDTADWCGKWQAKGGAK